MRHAVPERSRTPAHGQGTTEPGTIASPEEVEAECDGASAIASRVVRGLPSTRPAGPGGLGAAKCTSRACRRAAFFERRALSDCVSVALRVLLPLHLLGNQLPILFNV